MQLSITEFGQVISINTLLGPIDYFIPPKEIINIKTHKWSLVLTISNLSLQNFMLIYHAIMFENTIIF